jgi:hypothetical protein
MANGRCRLHGGLSTGLKTAEGIKRIQEANTELGRYSKAARELRRRKRESSRELLREFRMFRKLLRWRKAIIEKRRDTKRVAYGCLPIRSFCSID